MSTRAKPFLTPEQYLEIERTAEYKSEYFDGDMYAMAGGTLNHSRIFHNLAAVLNTQLRGRPCEVAGSDLRLQVKATGLITYPDLVVFCGKPQFVDRREDTIADATVIIEILSPSTQDRDRGFKFDQYRKVPSFQDYIVISQDRVHVEHLTRQEDGAWLLRETSDVDTVVRIASIDCCFRVGDAYERVEFGMTGNDR